MLTAWAADEPWLDGRLLIAPHAADNSPDSIEGLRHKAAERARAMLNGKRPPTLVNSTLMKQGS